MRLYLFLFFLVLIAILSTFYIPASLIKVEASIYNNTASPYCIDWMGTSIFVENLRKNNITVDIVSEPSDLEKSLRKGGLFIIVAPDKPIPINESLMIKKYFENGTINIAVFDENITSNNLLREFGVLIDGRLVLDPYTPNSPYYPITQINLSNFRGIVRLNWASFIEKTAVPRQYGYRIFSTTYGVVDLNNNGKLDQSEIVAASLPTSRKEHITGVIVRSENSTIVVFTDSYPLINSAFLHNYTLSRIMTAYLIDLAKEKNTRVIIPNYHYKATSISVGIPFHFSLLLLFFADMLHYFDGIIEKYVYSTNYLYLGFFIVIVLSITLLLRTILGIKNIAELQTTSLIEQGILIETLAAKNLREKGVLKQREKQLIINTWRILKNTYLQLRNIDIEDCVAKKNYRLLIELGLIQERDIKNLEKLYKVYLKAIGKKKLPIIFNWRKTVFKYIVTTEYFLNKIGCSIIRKKGYKDAAYIIKKQI